MSVEVSPEVTADSDDSVYSVDDSEERVDILSELNPRFPLIVDQILQYLSVRDLCSICCVSKSWRNTLLNSRVANHRRVRHLKKVKKLRKSVGQENWPIKKKTPVPAYTRRDALSDIRNVYRLRKPRRTSAQPLSNTTETPNARQRTTDMGLRGMR